VQGGTSKDTWRLHQPRRRLLNNRSILLLAVVFRVALRCFRGMVKSMDMVAVGDMRMVRGFLMIAGLMAFGRVLVVPSGVLMVVGRLMVMFRCLLRHAFLLWNGDAGTIPHRLLRSRCRVVNLR